MADFTFKDLKEAISKMTDEQLLKPAYLAKDDERWEKVTELCFIDEDIYVDKINDEDCGTLEDLQYAHGSDFVLEEYRLMTKKGTPYLAIVTED